MTRTGVGHDLGKATGGAVGRTTGKVVDAVMNPVGAVVGAVGEVGKVIGTEMFHAMNPFEFDYSPPKGIPRKIQQPREQPGMRLRKKRGDL